MREGDVCGGGREEEGTTLSLPDRPTTHLSHPQCIRCLPITRTHRLAHRPLACFPSLPPTSTTQCAALALAPRAAAAAARPAAASPALSTGTPHTGQARGRGVPALLWLPASGGRDTPAGRQAGEVWDEHCKCTKSTGTRWSGCLCVTHVHALQSVQMNMLWLQHRA